MDTEFLSITKMIDELSPKYGSGYTPAYIIKKAEGLTNILRYIADSDKAIMRDCYIAQVSERLKLDRQELLAEVEKLRNPKPKRDYNQIAISASLVIMAICVISLLIITFTKIL